MNRVLTITEAEERLRDLETMRRKEKANPEMVTMIEQQLHLLRSWISKAMKAR